MKKWPAEGKSAGRFLHIGCILACFGIRAGFVLEFAPRQVSRSNPWVEICSCPLEEVPGRCA